MYTDNLYYQALEKKYEGEIAEGKAVLKTFFEKDVGVADHSQFLVIFDEWIGKINDAQEKLDTLRYHYGEE
jgi:hypothetical protein|tara:strand:- start:1169 stop:1381 length:213 start_codon:yes stop_codon:yes gene_type:complete